MLVLGNSDETPTFPAPQLVLCFSFFLLNLISPHVVKLYHSLAKPYVNLAHSFQRGDLKHLEAEVDAARDIWCTVS